MGGITDRSEGRSARLEAALCIRAAFSRCPENRDRAPRGLGTAGPAFWALLSLASAEDATADRAPISRKVIVEKVKVPGRGWSADGPPKLYACGAPGDLLKPRPRRIMPLFTAAEAQLFGAIVQLSAARPDRASPVP